MDDSQLSSLVASVLSADAFFRAPDVQIRIERRPRETCRWEVFRGHLLDARQTRSEREFVSWCIWIDDPRAPQAAGAPSPIVSLHWDSEQEQLHVTRAILVRGWEVVEPRPGFLESRPAALWTRELVATLDFRAPWRRDAAIEVWRSELSSVVAQAWTGVSRLPITSIEAPLPGFSLGRSGYDRSLALPSSPTAERLLCDAWDRPGASASCWRLEMALRSLECPPRASMLAATSTDQTLSAARVALVRSLFHGLSLSPFTGFTANLLALVEAALELRQWTGAQAADLISHMIRHLVRHLTAYDLVKFHSFGANYPDALWLDQLLKALFGLASRWPQSFLDDPQDDVQARREKRLRRRGLRQGWLVHRQYEGRRVPDAPTSQGEHLRILPSEIEVAPEQQITEPGTRRKQLYADSPSRSLIPVEAAPIWQAALEDLRGDDELRELGMGTFLDRPLGIFKPPGAVDRTPLLAYEACSRQIAVARLTELARVAGDQLPPGFWDQSHATLESLTMRGTPVQELPGDVRPGVIMLEDARQASPDFVVCRTMPGSLRRLAETPVMWNEEQRRRLRDWAEDADASLLVRAGSAERVRATGVWMERRDAEGRVIDQLQCTDAAWGEYGEAWGVEFPRAQFVMQHSRSSSQGSKT